MCKKANEGSLMHLEALDVLRVDSYEEYLSVLECAKEQGVNTERLQSERFVQETLERCFTQLREIERSLRV